MENPYIIECDTVQAVNKVNSKNEYRLLEKLSAAKGIYVLLRRTKSLST